MSYFDFYKKNIIKPAEVSQSSTIPEDEVSHNTVSRPAERFNRPKCPQDAVSTNDVDRPCGKNKDSKKPHYERPTQKYYKVKKSTSMDPSEHTEIIKGTCLTMCPEDEVLMREKARMVHMLEVIDGKRVLVKCFSRSAADSKMAVPRLLRPYEVLQDTVQHLLFCVAQTKDTSKNVVYDFVCDRLRALRQDMTVQRLPAAKCITLLEPMIRFHVYFGYILCEYPINVYDPVLNKKLLLECLKWFLSCCDSIEQSPDDLNSEMSQLNINHNLENYESKIGMFRKNQENTKCDRVLMETLYILCNLDDVHPMYRFWGLSRNLKSNPSIKLAYKIAVANLRGNYVQVCQQLKNLCPLTYCSLCLYLPTVQRRGLHVMSTAYSSKQLSVPLSAVCRWLSFDSSAEAARVGAHYGLRVAGDGLRLTRADFKADVATHQPTRPLLLDQKMDLSVQHVITYNSKDYSYSI